MRPDYGWYYYQDTSCNAYYNFIDKNPIFDSGEFNEYAICHNRADRDSGELADIAFHEVLRLAAEFTEHKWRFDNCYSEWNENARRS